MLEQYGPVMSVQEVCETLNIGKNTVYLLIQDGEIQAYRTGRTWKINRDGLIKYIRNKAGLTDK